jgi:hypothetical protein
MARRVTQQCHHPFHDLLTAVVALHRSELRGSDREDPRHVPER